MSTASWTSPQLCQRRLAITEQVPAELLCLEQAGKIKKVDASEWTSLVVVRKKDCSIRLCVDLWEAKAMYHC